MQKMYISKSVESDFSTSKRSTMLFCIFSLRLPGSSNSSCKEKGFHTSRSLSSPSLSIKSPEHQNPDSTHVALFCVCGIEYGLSLQGQLPRERMPMSTTGSLQCSQSTVCTMSITPLITPAVHVHQMSAT